MKITSNRSDDLSRRRFMAGAASTFLGVGMLPITGRDAYAAGEGASPLKQVATAKRVIYLYMSGGMSHLDTLDVKPGAETQGSTKAIATSADGVQISEYLPKLAQQMHHIAIVNSLSSTAGAHEQGNYLMHTSYPMRGTIKHPSMGAWLLKFHGWDNTTLPGSVAIGGASRSAGAGFFESRYSPLMVNNPEAGLQNSRNRMPEDDFQYRLGLSRELSASFREKYDQKNVRAYTDMYDDAVKLMKSRDLEAFSLAKEPDEVRDRYGRNAFGQGCLLARRLAESGVKFVEVTLGGWDTHQSNFIRVPERCEMLDSGVSCLLQDLERQGLLNDTLVVLATEFGRTPRINQNAGRDHYPKAFSAFLAGGGVKGGQRWGKTGKTGEEVVENKIAIPDFNATIGFALGLPLNQVLYSPSRRPFTVAHNGQPVTELFG